MFSKLRGYANQGWMPSVTFHGIVIIGKCFCTAPFMVTKDMSLWSQTGTWHACSFLSAHPKEILFWLVYLKWPTEHLWLTLKWYPTGTYQNLRFNFSFLLQSFSQNSIHHVMLEEISSLASDLKSGVTRWLKRPPSIPVLKQWSFPGLL